MKQNQNNIECAPTKQEEGVANKAMAKEKLDQAEDKQKLQDIIDVCDSNIEDIKEKEQEKEDGPIPQH